MEQQLNFPLQLRPILFEPHHDDGVRLLQSSVDSGAVLYVFVFVILLVVIFCYIFVPMIRSHHNAYPPSLRYNQHQHPLHPNHINEVREIIQLTLNNSALLGGVHVVDGVTFRGTTTGGIQTIYRQSIRTMSLEDRRQRIHNVLLSKVCCTLLFLCP
jgi:hypothetical protein